MLNRYTELKRKTPLARSTKPLQRKKRLNPVSKTRKAKAAQAVRDYEDSQRIAFEEVRGILGEDLRQSLSIAAYTVAGLRIWQLTRPSKAGVLVRKS